MHPNQMIYWCYHAGYHAGYLMFSLHQVLALSVHWSSLCQRAATPESNDQCLQTSFLNDQLIIYIYTYIYTYMPLISWPDCKSLRCNSKPWRNSLKTLWASKVSSDVMFNSWPGSVVKCGQGCYQINIYYNICRSALQTFQVLDFESLKSVLPAQPELTVFPENSLSSSLLLVLEFKHLLTEGWNGANRIQSMIFLVSK